MALEWRFIPYTFSVKHDEHIFERTSTDMLRYHIRIDDEPAIEAKAKLMMNLFIIFFFRFFKH
jgi:hypothetical protein